MKKFISSVLLCISALTASAADTTPWRYVDVTDLRMINRGFPEQTATPFTRLPIEIQDSVRPTLWERSQCSSGIATRFATDSHRIGISYDLLHDFTMIHMADTGTKGMGLYIFEGDSVWRHVNTIRPYVERDSAGEKTKHVEKIFVENLDGQMHEYMLYFPLYDGVTAAAIKIDSAATINSGNKELIRPDGRIVAYGTSILQGGCASRPGMASTNILSRELNREVINLGFSGEGKMDSVMARAMAQIPDVAIYVLDPVPNCTEAMCDSLTYGFVKILRDARPDVPIVMVEGPMYPYSRYDKNMGTYLPRKNAAYRRNYELLKAERPEGLYYVTSEDLDGPEDDGTVDGIHLTDLGFRHYADKLLPVLQSILDSYQP